jgi:hypothetical protein
MSVLLLVLILLLVCGGGYWGCGQWGPGFGGILGLVLLIIILVYVFGGGLHTHLAFGMPTHPSSIVATGPFHPIVAFLGPLHP